MPNTESSAQPYITPRQARVAAIVVALAAMNCVGGRLVTLSVPTETHNVIYWPYLFYWYQGAITYLALPAACVGLAAFLAVRQLQLRTRGLVHAVPVIGFLVAAVVACLGSVSFSFMGGYVHIATAHLGNSQYHVGRTYDIDGYRDIWLCAGNNFNLLCRFQRIQATGWVDAPIRVTTSEADNTLTVLLGDEIIFTSARPGD